MFISKHVLACLSLTISASAAALSAAVAQSAATAATAATPSSVATAAIVDSRAVQATESVRLCRDLVYNVPEGCENFNVQTGICVNFTGSLSSFNKNLTYAFLPGNYKCNFYREPSCRSSSANDYVTLGYGANGFESVRRGNSYVNFNDMASSFTCSLG